EITIFGKKNGVVFSPNMSIGVNITFKLLQIAATLFNKNYDIEIIESHHKNKVDAPSGTALEMAKIISSSNTFLSDHNYCFNRVTSSGPRKEGEIGFSVIRGGDIVGEHSVLFAGMGEVIEISHKSNSRDSYAQGALLASEFLCKNPPAFYNMSDVLGFN
ncbi:MAG: 4-hydroxy-tetrahydrodipicolinate reductase, partial [Betaproteobacteria bacterium TMED156]